MLGTGQPVIHRPPTLKPDPGCQQPLYASRSETIRDPFRARQWYSRGRPTSPGPLRCESSFRIPLDPTGQGGSAGTRPQQAFASTISRQSPRIERVRPTSSPQRPGGAAPRPGVTEREGWLLELSAEYQQLALGVSPNHGESPRFRWATRCPNGLPRRAAPHPHCDIPRHEHGVTIHHRRSGITSRP